jgi:hypothetical protein
MKPIYVFFSLILIISCEKTEISEFQDKPVVESYLYADESPTVKVSKLIAFKDDMQFSDMDVNKLEVSITDMTSGKKYSLTSKGDGTYKNESLIVAAGKTYQLSFPYNGQVVTATTVVPRKPQNFLLSTSNIAISQRGGTVSGGGAPEMPSPIAVTWVNEDQSYYLIYVKNVESAKVAIDTKSNMGNDFFRNQPTNIDHYELNPRSFQYYGQHRIILYKIQPEYVLFFQENSNSSLSISEIKANIVNGFGIFTAINSVSAYLYVGKP